jgi:hypothetical protein
LDAYGEAVLDMKRFSLALGWLSGYGRRIGVAGL